MSILYAFQFARLRGLREALEVPPLCRETLASRTANVGTVGMNTVATIISEEKVKILRFLVGAIVHCSRTFSAINSNSLSDRLLILKLPPFTSEVFQSMMGNYLYQ